MTYFSPSISKIVKFDLKNQKILFQSPESIELKGFQSEKLEIDSTRPFEGLRLFSNKENLILIKISNEDKNHSLYLLNSNLEILEQKILKTQKKKIENALQIGKDKILVLDQNGNLLKIDWSRSQDLIEQEIDLKKHAVNFKTIPAFKQILLHPFDQNLILIYFVEENLKEAGFFTIDKRINKENITKNMKKENLIYLRHSTVFSFGDFVVFSPRESAFVPIVTERVINYNMRVRNGCYLALI